MDSHRFRTESESSDKSGPRFVLPGTPSSPARILSLDEVQDMVKNIKNMALAHEIAVNTDFKLEKYEPPENSIEKIIKETMHKAFWDILRTQLESEPPVYDHALVLLADIKEAFQSIFLENNKKALDKINEMLDTDLIKQQAEQGVLDFKSYSNYIIHIMSLACAPIRDEQVAKLREIEDIVDSFKGILETLELMKLDMANCILNAARNEVIANSVKYEQQKFKEYLEFYKDGFPATEKWLKRNIPEISETEQSTSTQTNDINPDKKIKDVIFNAYMELLSWDKENDFPEFFSMDRERLVALQGRALRVCACASSLAIVSGLPAISQSAEIKKSLAKEIEILLQNVNTEKELEDALQNVWLQIKSVLTKRLHELYQKSLDDETESSLKAHIMKIATLDESPVRKLMWKRLYTYIQLILRSNVAIPPPPGFQEFSDELEALGQAFRRVTYYNYAVYNEYYNEILNKLSSN
ncbi:T-complex protein 11-like protein 1 isoform X2 [Chironomus tepperi]